MSIHLPDVVSDPRSGTLNRAIPAIQHLQKARGLPPFNAMERGARAKRPTMWLAYFDQRWNKVRRMKIIADIVLDRWDWNRMPQGFRRVVPRVLLPP
jgi:hypothetical protein